MSNAVAEATIAPAPSDGAVGHLVQPAWAWAVCAHCAEDFDDHRNSVNDTYDALRRHLRDVHGVHEPVIEDRIPR